MLQWQPHPTNRLYQTLDTRPIVQVRIEPLPQGYLLQCSRYAAWFATLPEAKDFGEAVAENLTIPVRERWARLSSIFGR